MLLERHLTESHYAYIVFLCWIHKLQYNIRLFRDARSRSNLSKNCLPTDYAFLQLSRHIASIIDLYVTVRQPNADNVEINNDEMAIFVC